MTAVLIRSGWWESPEMERRDDATAAWVAGILAERFGDSTISGLYLATSDSGASESIDFWRSALETGLAFAGPGAFPWTLANSPTGRIAARLGIRGPTYTLVGGADALAAAAGHALDDVACGVGPALLVALDGTDRGTVVVAAVELALSDAADGPMLSRAAAGGWGDSESATSALCRFIEWSAGTSGSFG